MWRGVLLGSLTGATSLVLLAGAVPAAAASPGPSVANFDPDDTFSAPTRMTSTAAQPSCRSTLSFETDRYTADRPMVFEALTDEYESSVELEPNQFDGCAAGLPGETFPGMQMVFPGKKYHPRFNICGGLHLVA